MVSYNNTKSYYSNNERKLRQFRKENYIREDNNEQQQAIVDEQVAKELGLEVQATSLGELGSRVAKKLTFGTDIAGKPTPVVDIIRDAISTGKLSNLFDRLKAIPDSKLTRVQKIIKRDLNNPEVKSMINSLIAEALPQGVEGIRKAFLEGVAGKDNEGPLLDMVAQVAPPDPFDTIGFTNSIPNKLEDIDREVDMSGVNIPRMLERITNKNDIRALGKIALAFSKVENGGDPKQLSGLLDTLVRRINNYKSQVEYSEVKAMRAKRNRILDRVK